MGTPLSGHLLRPAERSSPWRMLLRRGRSPRPLGLHLLFRPKSRGYLSMTLAPVGGAKKWSVKRSRTLRDENPLALSIGLDLEWHGLSCRLRAILSTPPLQRRG